MLSVLMEVLTDEQLELVRAKLASGAAASNVLAEHMARIADGLDEDWPWQDRNDAMDMRFWDTPEHKLAVWYTDRIFMVGQRYHSHEDTRRELVELASW